MEAAAAVEHTLNGVLDALDAAGLEWEDPLREQMSRDLPPIPGRVSPDVTNVVADEVGRARRDGRRNDGTRDLGGRLVGLPGSAFHGDDSRAGERAEHRPLVEDVTRGYRHIDSPDPPVRWSPCRPTRLSTIW